MTTGSQTPGEPTEWHALVALARREHRAGRLAEAAGAYRKVLAIRPDLAEIHNELGVILAQQEMLEPALVLFGKAIALRPDYAEAYNNLSKIF